jgi:hypothetical protein
MFNNGPSADPPVADLGKWVNERVLSIKFLDIDIGYEPAINIDLKRFYHIGLPVVTDKKSDPALLRFWKPELLIKSLFSECALVQGSAVLVSYDNRKLIAGGIGAGDVENDHIILCAKVLYRGRFFLCDYHAGLGAGRADGKEKEGPETKPCDCSDKIRLHIKWVFVTIRI